MQQIIQFLLDIFFKKAQSLDKELEQKSKETELKVDSKEPIIEPKIPEKSVPMKISEQGLKLITSNEGLKLKPYYDSVLVPTIGYGSTYYEDGTKVTIKDAPITEERAVELLKNVVKTFEESINKLVKVKLTQNQFDSLVCFTYNIGISNFTNSTMLRLLNQGKYEEAAKEFSRWNKAGGKVLAGLVRRRKEEMELFLRTV